MYRYLDRSIADIRPAEQLLVRAMRNWVAVLASGRCPCATLGPLFRACGVEQALPDFNTGMLLLNGESQGPLRFAPPCARDLSDDEARLLVLFDAGFSGNDTALRRFADQLVQPQAVWHLITAVERVTAMLAGIAAPGQPEERA